jgi:hypothetical protein
MRALALLLTVLLVVAVAVWQAPELVPPPLRGALASVESQIVTVMPQSLRADANAPVWPDARDKNTRQQAMFMRWGIAAGVASIALLAVLGIWRFSRRPKALPSMPAWLATARVLAKASSDRKDRDKQCALLEKTLLPDMKERGELALARAHQLDLYWRAMSRNQASASLKPAQLERIRAASKRTLDTIAQAAQPPRKLSAFPAAKASLWALEPGDARQVETYYDQLGAFLEEHDKAMATARAVTEQKPLDPAAVLQSMETLRQINRTIAKETAALTGDFQISVRAFD